MLKFFHSFELNFLSATGISPSCIIPVMEYSGPSVFVRGLVPGVTTRVSHGLTLTLFWIRRGFISRLQNTDSEFDAGRRRCRVAGRPARASAQHRDCPSPATARSDGAAVNHQHFSDREFLGSGFTSYPLSEPSKVPTTDIMLATWRPPPWIDLSCRAPKFSRTKGSVEIQPISENIQPTERIGRPYVFPF
jgi:hypothetical protein